MLAGMDEDLFQRWLKFFAEEPFGPQVETLMSAVTAAASAGSGDVDAFLPLTVSAE